jgi:hypothetical protein
MIGTHDFFKSQIGNHPQEDLAKFCYIPKINLFN